MDLKYTCPLPVLSERQDDDLDDMAPRTLYLQRCDHRLYVCNNMGAGSWEVSPNGTNDGEMGPGSTEVRCGEGHVLLTVYNDTERDIAPVTEDWVRQAVEFASGVDLALPSAPPHPVLLKCQHCGQIGERQPDRPYSQTWHDPDCWWLTDEARK